ncbi:MAG: hypothetical protein Q8Q24_02520 [bacterium]|nr:hypothetical protein [bacterium]
MKIVISRVETDLGDSTVNDCRVSTLPEGLKSKVMALLGNLAGVKRITEVEEARPTIELADKNVGIGFLSVETRAQYFEVLSLLRWYLKEHWFSTGRRGAIGGTTHCVDCGTGKIIGSGSGYCGNPDCPSHEKWKEVLGDLYKGPSLRSPLFKGPGIKGSTH